jgi:hypothetical protein
MPAIFATPRGSDLGTFPDFIALIVDGRTFRVEIAFAVRSELNFVEMSRMLLSIEYSLQGTCVEFKNQVGRESQKGHTWVRKSHEHELTMIIQDSSLQRFPDDHLDLPFQPPI